MCVFNKVLETILRDFGSYWHECSSDNKDPAKYLHHYPIMSFYVVCINCHIRLSYQKSSIIRPSNIYIKFFLHVVPTLKIPVLRCQEQHPVWTSAAVVHLTQGSFRDALLHSLVITSGYLISFCLSIKLKQSANFPLTSDISKAFTIFFRL